MDDIEFRPTHVTPLDGMPTWAGPDTSQPSAWLDALLPVRVTDLRGDWARILCANGWSAWVDGRLLVALPDRPPGTTRPLAGTADPRALLARLEHAVSTYRHLVEQLADGAIDLQTFQERSAGLRIGAVVDGESAWLLDLEHDRWWYCHAAQSQTFATVEAPPDGKGEKDGKDEKRVMPDSAPGALGNQPPVRAAAHPAEAGEHR